MSLDVPKGVKSFCRSGANPFQPAEIVAKLRQQAHEMQQRGDAQSQE
jgi:hypothetical protein